MSNPRAAVTIGWADVPWLDEDTKRELLKSTPPYLRDAVVYGLPNMGTGAVYPVPLEEVVLAKPIEIPKYYKKIYGLDVGWRRTAACFLALNPDDDVAYAYSEYYGSKQEPEIHAARIKRIAGDWMPGVIDPASSQRSQQSGEQLQRLYNKLGLRLRPANNVLDVGLLEVWSRLSTGRLKFLPNLLNLQNEYVLYRRDENGRIVKENDHLMDALRYAVMALASAKAESSANSTLTTAGRRYYDV